MPEWVGHHRAGGAWAGPHLHIDLVCLFDFCCFQSGTGH